MLVKDRTNNPSRCTHPCQRVAPGYAGKRIVSSLVEPSLQLPPYEQRYDAEGIINPAKKLVAREILGAAPPPTINAGRKLRPRKTKRAGSAQPRPVRYQKTGELLFVANAVNANNCARCVFDRLIAGDKWYAHNRCLAVVWFTLR